MSWSTNLFCNMSFSRKTYNNRYEVESELEDLHKQIETCKQTLRDLTIMTEPSKFYNKEEYYSPYDFVHQEFEDNAELLIELTIEEYKLNFLLKNWDQCHTSDGLAISPPEDIHWNTAFLNGDFIKTVNNPNGEG